MIKIAYITASLEGSGGPLPIPAVTRVMRDAGAEVEVFALTRRDGRALPGMLADGLTVHIREGGDKDHLKAYQWLDQQLQRYKPTLLWTSVARASIIGLLLGKKYNIPVVCWQHNAYLKLSRLIPYYLLRKRPIMWVGDSDVVSALTAKRFGIPPERIATWPLFAADPDAPQSKPWQHGEVLRIGSLGRLHPQKCYKNLIDALVLLKERGFKPSVKFEISIAGDGRDREKLEAAAKAAGCTEIKFIGFVDKPKEFLTGIHLYLQPSRLEGFCIAVHEAMQASVPVIATTVGQIPYSIESGKTGWLIPPNDIPALADALENALLHPEQLAQMGQMAREKVLETYSQDVFRKAGESILDRICPHLGQNNQ